MVHDVWFKMEWLILKGGERLRVSTRRPGNECKRGLRIDTRLEETLA